MRDILCGKEDLIETIGLNAESIPGKKQKIANLKSDIENAIQRYPKNNEDIVRDTYLSIFRYSIQNICAKYSLGNQIADIEEDYLEAINALENIGERKVGYVNLIWLVAIGILLETDKENMKKLSNVVEKESIDDALMDFLLRSCNIGWSHESNHYEKENPYAKTEMIIFDALQLKDTKKASEKLRMYMEKDWFQGHYDYEWKDAHKHPGYVGFWSFETAAIAKLLQLDDECLKDTSHYPYELAHYKNQMLFRIAFDSQESDRDDCKSTGDSVISNNKVLEQVIPVCFRSYVDEIIDSYNKLSDGDFYGKYKLQDIWFTEEEYVKENKERKLLGSIIVFLLVNKKYILQLDYKEDLDDYKENLVNYWKGQEVKKARLQLNNDQNYYVYIPEKVDITNIYEVAICDM